MKLFLALVLLLSLGLGVALFLPTPPEPPQVQHQGVVLEAHIVDYTGDVLYPIVVVYDPASKQKYFSTNCELWKLVKVSDTVRFVSQGEKVLSLSVQEDALDGEYPPTYPGG